MLLAEGQKAHTYMEKGWELQGWVWMGPIEAERKWEHTGYDGDLALETAVSLSGF